MAGMFGDYQSWINQRYTNPLGAPNLDPEDMAAQVAKDQYANYMSTYAPVEDYVFQQLANWQPLTQEAQQSAIFQSNRQYGNVQRQQERQFRSFGVDPTPEQKESLKRQMDVSAALSAINAANTTGRQMDDMRYGLVGGFGPYQGGQ